MSSGKNKELWDLPIALRAAKRLGPWIHEKYLEAEKKNRKLENQTSNKQLVFCFCLNCLGKFGINYSL